jgi:hypothetical protein
MSIKKLVLALNKNAKNVVAQSSGKISQINIKGKMIT